MFWQQTRIPFLILSKQQSGIYFPRLRLLRQHFMFIHHGMYIYNIVSFILRMLSYNASHTSHITNPAFLSVKIIIINNFQQVRNHHSKLNRVIIENKCNLIRFSQPYYLGFQIEVTLPSRFLLITLLSRLSFQSNLTIHVPSHSPTIQAFISK